METSLPPQIWRQESNLESEKPFQYILVHFGKRLWTEWLVNNKVSWVNTNLRNWLAEISFRNNPTSHHRCGCRRLWQVMSVRLRRVCRGRPGRTLRGQLTALRGKNTCLALKENNIYYNGIERLSGDSQWTPAVKGLFITLTIFDCNFQVSPHCVVLLGNDTLLTFRSLDTNKGLFDLAGSGAHQSGIYGRYFIW